MKDHNLKQNDC